MADSADARSKRSSGEWLFQLTTITVGVLIALSFDAVLRWNSDRLLVAEAKETLAREIADNRRHMEGHLAALPRRIEQVDVVLQLMDDLLADKEPSIHAFEIFLSMPELTSAGWETAERTGALALMDYGDVQRFALLYGFQDLFVGQMQRLIEPLTFVQVYVRNGPPTNRNDLEAARTRLIELRGGLLLHEQLARQISERYAEYTADSPRAAASP